MKQIFTDKKGVIIQEPGKVKFSIPDKLEKSGLCEWEAPVKIFQGMMGWYSKNEKRVIPFREFYPDGKVYDAVFIKY